MVGTRLRAFRDCLRSRPPLLSSTREPNNAILRRATSRRRAAKAASSGSPRSDPGRVLTWTCGRGTPNPNDEPDRPREYPRLFLFVARAHAAYPYPGSGLCVLPVLDCSSVGYGQSSRRECCARAFHIRRVLSRSLIRDPQERLRASEVAEAGLLLVALRVAPRVLNSFDRRRHAN